MRYKGILAAFVVTLLFSLSPLAADPVIERGIDVFTTTADGSTYYDFAVNPIPAGFFCKRSAAFAGRVALKGLPLETEVPGQLRGTDTVIERLDDAVFDADGAAVTRVRFRALSMVSIAPIKTACGAFHVYITLDGPQRATKMRIHRTHELGGTFLAPLSAAIRMTFVPVKGRSARRLEMTGSINFPATAIPWSLERNPTVNMKRIESLVVDTNGDLIPDALLPGTSNFAPGWSPRQVATKWGCYQCEPPMCHDADGCEHCTGGITVCNGAVCP